MASVNQTRPHCVNQMGKTHSKPLAARHGRGTAWERHAMCESALSGLRSTVHGPRILKDKDIYLLNVGHHLLSNAASHAGRSECSILYLIYLWFI